MTDRIESGATGTQPEPYECITDAVFALDPDWRFTFVNERAERAFDLEDVEVIDRSIWEVLPEWATSEFRARCQAAFEDGTPTQFEQPAPASNGLLSVRIYPAEDGISVCFREVGEEGTAESDLAEGVTEVVADAAVTIDADGVIRHANSATEGLLGFQPSELIGESFTSVLPERHREEHEAELERLLDTESQEAVRRGLEFPGVRKDGEEIELSVSYRTYEQEAETYVTGVIRDVTDRKRREWALQEAYETISDTALDFEQKVDALLEISCEVLGMSYGTLSQIQEETYLFDRVVAPEDADLEPGDTVELATTNCERVVTSEETLALADIERDAPELAGREGNAEWGIASYVGVPITIDDEVTGTFCFYDMEPRSEEFSQWQVAFLEYLGQWVSHELERQRYIARLAALNELNQVEHEISNAVIEQSTREEIESRVCEALAAADSYQFAWIGEPNPHTQEVELRTEAGVSGYLDSVSISVAPEDPESQGPTGRAIQTGETQTAQRVLDEESYEPWHDSAERHGYRSSAAVPIVHEGTVYGVLNIYTARPDAFEREERSVVGLLGKIIGHAIVAADRKRALLADSVVELDLRVTGALEEIQITEPPSDGIIMDAAVPQGDGEFVVFGSTNPDDLPFLRELAEKLDPWKELIDVDAGDERVSYEALLEEPPFLTRMGEIGGRLVQGVIEADDIRVRVQLPHSASVRQSLDALREAYPDTTLVSKQEVTPSRTAETGESDVSLDDLTNRQLETLRTAYHAGYFDWPRETSGEEVAEILGISSPTFSQHLRGAEETVFGSLLSDRTD